MALEVFDFPYHLTETDNPESGFRGVMGGSYTFTAAPTDPDQRLVTLTFKTMKFYTDNFGMPEALTEPQLNMKTLIDFYQRHKLYKSFHYYHPVHGQMEVKFNKPLKEPKPMEGGTGAVEGFTIELIEIP